MSESWTHPLIHAIKLPDGKEITELAFPKMKGKFMRKFAARAEENSDKSGSSAVIEYDQFMTIGELMLAETQGKIVARLIFEEMDPEDVHAVVAAVGERFAGGQQTGATA